MSKDRRSSGDLVADRRFAWAMDYARAGDEAAALDLLRQTVEAAPRWAGGWFALGEAAARAGLRDEAQAAFARAVEIDPSDALGAGVRRDALAGVTPAALPRAHVAALFDDYAARFDAHLVQGLGYRAPALLRAAVDRVRPQGRFGLALDLGCGTGLAGEAFAARVDALVGVDLSPRMLAHPRVRRLYAEAVEGDLVEVLAARPAASADLALAADVLVYLGDLAPVFAAVARALRPGAPFTFTAQKGDGDGFALGSDLRFRHGEPYLRGLAAAHGFEVSVLDEVATRRDAGADVPGLLAVWTRG